MSGRSAFSIARRATLAATLLLALTACGGERKSAGTAPADAGIEVRALDGLAWNSKNYTAEAGKVTLFGANDSVLPHNVHVLDADGKDMATAINLPTPGSSGTMELDLAPGTYRIVCKIAGHTSMDSTLTVS
ncbi:MAG: plastocyanin/azurin family copper-binding protein [Ilumatobacteraceae bacterium]